MAGTLAMGWLVVNGVLTFGLAVATFLIMHLVPGDPVQTTLGNRATAESIATAREQFTAVLDRLKASGKRVAGYGASPTVKWKYKIGNFVRQSSPAIDKNGILYFGDLSGYVYAFAAQRTYENAAATSFILERSGKDGRWRIAAHQSGSYGIPPDKITRPMPDLRTLFYATEGKDRDPAADARAAAEN